MTNRAKTRHIVPSAQTTAVIYIRVSSKEQQQEGFSLDAQLKLLNEYARKNGLSVIHTYMDVESAKSAGRTEFGHLLEFLGNQNECTTVLVEKTDRFYRNIHDLVTIRDLGVSVHLVKESSVMSPSSRSHETFVHGLNVLLAERMVNNLSEEVKKGMTEKARQGIWPSQAPIGFRNVEGACRKRVIEKDPEQAPLVKKMFELYATGLYSAKEICKEAATIGLVHKKTGNKLAKSVLTKLLKNPIYYGDFYWKGQLYNGNHEPIIDRELFDRVQRMFDKRTSCPTGRQKHDFQFHGLMVCEYCGCAMVSEIKKGQYVYYHCTGNKGKCPGRYVREEEVSKQYLSYLKQVQLDQKVVDWVVTELSASSKEVQQQQEQQVAELTRQRKSLEHRLEQMYLDKLDGILDNEEYIRLSNKFRSEITRIRFKLEKSEVKNDVQVEQAARTLELAQSAVNSYSAGIHGEKRKLLNQLCSNSTWGCGELKVKFRQPFDIIATTNHEYNKKKATFCAESGDFEIWRARRDSNSRPTDS